MKKILILSHAMELGGAERALLGLLESIDLQKNSVDLLHHPERMKQLAENCLRRDYSNSEEVQKIVRLIGD